MSDTINFLESLIEERLADLHTCMFAKIVSYDPVENSATVQPLHKRKFKGENPINLPIIANVPVMSLVTGDFFIRIPYKKDDVVLLVFSERSYDSIINLGVDQDETKRKHNLEDAVVIGGINLFSNNLSSTNSNDMLIAKKDMSSKVVIQANGNIVIEASNISLGEGATQAVPLGTALKTWLDSHTHSSDGAGSPTSASPNPSGVVKVK